jgi:hypothetical protein
MNYHKILMIVCKNLMFMYVIEIFNLEKKNKRKKTIDFRMIHKNKI